MKLLRAGVAALLTLVTVTAVSAQSLGEVARREEERRKTIASPAKVYTNDSLRSVPESIPTPAAPASAPAAAVPAAGPASGPQAQLGNKAAPPADDSKKDEAFWRKRIDDARLALARAQMFHDALQNQINSLATDFVNTDNPAQRAKVGADRQKALAELERLRQEIAQDQKTIADIQEEARRASVPAGWVR